MDDFPFFRDAALENFLSNTTYAEFCEKILPGIVKLLRMPEEKI